MKRKFILVLAFFISLTSCIKRPVDDLDLLITNQSSCYIGNFFLYGSDHINCLVPTKTVVDTINLTSLSIDSKVTPAMGNWMDFTLPQKYTVISGNRQVKKEYTITVIVEG
jgi:hypothetical protein